MARSRVVNLANFQQFTAVNFLSDPGAIGGPKLAPSCAEVRLNFSLDDAKAAHIVLHGRYSGTFNGTPAQAQTIYTALASGAPWTALAAFLSTTTVFQGVSLRDINTAGNPYIDSGVFSNAGSSASPAVPNEVALVGTLRTAKVGPSGRGRMYLAGWATNALGAGNTVAAAAVTAYGNWMATITTALSASGYTWAIALPARAAYTGSTGTAHPARAATTQPITNAIVRDNHWDSQRRRGLK